MKSSLLYEKVDREPARPLRVLIVEDRRDDAELMLYELRQAGFAPEGEVVETEADYSAHLQEGLDVVLADYTLPGFTISRALQLLRERNLDVPLIVVTGSVSEEVAVECMKQGVADYVLKDRLGRLGLAIRHTLQKKELRVEKRRAEEALRESEEQYRDLCENANDLIQKVTPDGTFVYVNRAWRETLGYHEEEIPGLLVSQVLHPDHQTSYFEVFWRVMAGEKMDEKIETVFVTKDGREIPVEGSINCQFVDGRAIATRGIFRDISARKALERQRADFLAMLTHDIKNPLSVILGYAQLLLEEAKARGKSQEAEALQRIESSALSVHSLVSNYLQLSRIEAGQLTLEKKPVLLNDMLRRVVQQHEGEARYRGIALRCHLQDSLPAVQGDVVALERIMTNLLNNALKFTPELGQVTVRSWRHEGEVGIAVEDTGPGIAHDEIATVFEKYQRVGSARRQEGVGLGLFIVKSLVEAQGGRVEVKSAVGSGSCFSVFLPIATTAQPDKASLHSLSVRSLSAPYSAAAL
jgi:PAS domain S-box-containing protein